MKPEARVFAPTLLMVAFIFQGSPTLVLPTPIASQKWRVVRLARQEKDGFHFLATGVALVRQKKTYVVTSAHVMEKVADPTKIYADFPPPVNAHPVSVLARSSRGDIVVLATDVRTDGNTVEKTGEAREGMPVFIVGFDDEHTATDNRNIQRGVIDLVAPWAEEKHMFILTPKYPGVTAPGLLISGVTCQPGGSGSPVFGADGKILGVVKGHGDDSRCIAIGISAAVKLLELQ